jgi:hypothetical protein
MNGLVFAKSLNIVQFYLRGTCDAY